MSGVSWYQVLGVEPSASAETIKAAWREATDKFEPGQGSGQFRLFNEAADVLLDPQARAAYDQEIGVAPTSPGRSAPSLTKTAPVRPTVTSAAAAAPLAGGTTLVRDTSSGDGALGVTHAVPHAGASRRVRRSRGAARAARPTAAGVPAWVIAVLAVLAVLALLVGLALFVNNRNATKVDDAGDDASAAAQRALPVVLSFDYRHLRADRDQAVRFMTPRYRREYTATFDKLISSSGSGPGPAAQTKAVVKASVEDVGVVSAESDRVRVIAFTNQSTTKGSAAATLSLNRLTVTMVRSGSSWLVENIVSY